MGFGNKNERRLFALIAYLRVVLMVRKYALYLGKTAHTRLDEFLESFRMCVCLCRWCGGVTSNLKVVITDFCFLNVRLDADLLRETNTVKGRGVRSNPKFLNSEDEPNLEDFKKFIQFGLSSLPLNIPFWQWQPLFYISLQKVSLPSGCM